MEPNNLSLILGIKEMSKIYRLSLLMNLSELAYNKFNFFNCKFHMSFVNDKVSVCKVVLIKRNFNFTQLDFKMDNKPNIYTIDVSELPNHVLEDIFNDALKLQQLNNIAQHEINLN